MTTGKHRWSAAAERREEYWTSILESPGYEEDADPPYDEVLAKPAPSWTIITARPCAPAPGSPCPSNPAAGPAAADPASPTATGTSFLRKRPEPSCIKTRPGPRLVRGGSCRLRGSESGFALSAHRLLVRLRMCIFPADRMSSSRKSGWATEMNVSSPGAAGEMMGQQLAAASII